MSIYDFEEWTSAACHDHGVRVVVFADEVPSLVELAIFGNDSAETSAVTWGLRQRLRCAWAALRGRLWKDQVCLGPDEARRLGEILIRAADAQPKGATRTAGTAPTTFGSIDASGSKP